jgi:hypothetical protein
MDFFALLTTQTIAARLDMLIRISNIEQLAMNANLLRQRSMYMIVQKTMFKSTQMVDIADASLE